MLKIHVVIVSFYLFGLNGLNKVLLCGDCFTFMVLRPFKSPLGCGYLDALQLSHLWSVYSRSDSSPNKQPLLEHIFTSGYSCEFSLSFFLCFIIRVDLLVEMLHPIYQSPSVDRFRIPRFLHHSSVHTNPAS